MQFHYRATDQDGRLQQGTLDAVNLADLELRLSRLGLILIRAKALQQGSLRTRRIRRRDLITFCFHLEQLTRAGVPLLEGLADLRDSLEHPYFRNVVASLIDDIEGGRSFSQALQAHPSIFDAVFVNLVRAGEVSGRLPEVLRNLTETLKWQDELAAQAKRLVLYPAFVGGLVLCVVVFLMVYLVPQLVEFIKAMHSTLPWNTRLLIAVSQLISAYWWVLLGVPFISISLARYSYKYSESFRYRVDALKLRIWVLGPILQKIILGRFASYFALMYAAGIPVLACLNVCQGLMGNRVISAALVRAEQQISEGLGVSAAFGQLGLFPPLVLRMLRVGENTGQLDDALQNAAYFYGRDVREAIERIQALVEPVMTVVLGLILLWIMASVLGPIFDTISRLR
ncbi:type II secretion system F family protein [Chitinilyticum piscinae]|uniref:Type II secretion system F family protein n=1 Tax=Chitinilyticum piscinae TaxID=2866724 RepID=A0A8J7FIU5_9NEIS|nr:type II secretion system F family protein [Chitinilyticum piscinae]MBE9607754.1 type II secretion system F family protein [Chitinilyticum piscinae]